MILEAEQLFLGGDEVKRANGGFAFLKVKERSKTDPGKLIHSRGKSRTIPKRVVDNGGTYKPFAIDRNCQALSHYCPVQKLCLLCFHHNVFNWNTS